VDETFERLRREWVGSEASHIASPSEQLDEACSEAVMSGGRSFSAARGGWAPFGDWCIDSIQGIVFMVGAGILALVQLGLLIEAAELSSTTCDSPRYITADDVGTTLADLVIMREVTRHTAGATTAAQQALPATAFGVFEALRAATEVCLGRSDLEGLRVAVQGLGNVGMPLCGYLSATGAALVVSDLDANRCAQTAAAYGATVVAPEEIHTRQVDVFAPAALGAVLNDTTIPRLGCRIACGGANNQLAEARHDAALAVRGIVFVPDYLANAGGVIDFHQETIDDQPAAVLASVARIGAITRDVLRCAAATGATPLSVADGIVGARIRRSS
jgi:leucine dehydrogenase